MNWIVPVCLIASVILHGVLLTRMARLLEKRSEDPELIDGLHQLAFSGDGGDPKTYRKAVAYVYCRTYARSGSREVRIVGDVVLLLTAATVAFCVFAIVWQGR